MLENKEIFFTRIYRLLFMGAFFVGMTACSNVGPGFANHPIGCSLGYVWDDCLPGTKGWDNGGGKVYREGAQKILDKYTQQQIIESSGGVIK
jgi:hypothetical protein